MAALLNSLFFMFKISSLPKYRVKYYDYIIKWCSGIYNVIGVYRWILHKCYTHPNHVHERPLAKINKTTIRFPIFKHKRPTHARPLAGRAQSFLRTYMCGLRMRTKMLCSDWLIAALRITYKEMWDLEAIRRAALRIRKCGTRRLFVEQLCE